MNPQVAVANFHQDKCAWEASISNNASGDPLEMWFNYIQWYEQHRTLDPENKFRQTLERCLSTFEYNESYKQDLRMIKLWMKYIGMQNNPLHLYQLLYQRNIGTQCSAFYIGWAHYYDAADALKQAESVYNLGFQAKAQPHEELHEAHTKFRLSISQRMLYEDNISKKRAASNMVDQRNNITSLNPPEKRQKTDTGNDATNITSGVGGGAGMNQTATSTNGNNGFSNGRSSTSTTTSYEMGNYNNSEEGSQCDLNNSAYVIASSLNSVYDDSDNYNQVDDSTVQPVAAASLDSGEIEGIKLYPNFVRSSKNNHELWTVPLCLEEPYDPDRRCYYPKTIVYPGDGDEYSLDEIRGRKWESRRQQIVYHAKIAAQRRQLEQQQKKHLELQAKQIQYQQQLDRQRQQQQQQQQQQAAEAQQQQQQQYYQNYQQNNYQNNHNYSGYSGPDNSGYYYNQSQPSGQPTQSGGYSYDPQQTAGYVAQTQSRNGQDVNQYNDVGSGYNQQAYQSPGQQQYVHGGYHSAQSTPPPPQTQQQMQPSPVQQHQQTVQYNHALHSPNYQLMNGNGDPSMAYHHQSHNHLQSHNHQPTNISPQLVPPVNHSPSAPTMTGIGGHAGISTTPDELDDFEEQIEASTIRFYPNNNAKSKTITIKFKKEKTKVPSSPAGGGGDGEPSAMTPQPATQKKGRRSKKNQINTPEGGLSSSSNSVDNRYYTTLKNYHGSEPSRSNEHSIDDANLLLSIGNVHSSSNDDSSQSQTKMGGASKAQNQAQFLTENDDSTSDFQSTFNGIYYGGENSNSTPVKMSRYLNDPTSNSKTSTPTTQNFRYLKNKSTNLSSQNDDSMCSYTGEQNSYFAAESDEEVKQRRVDNAASLIEKHLAKSILDPFSSELCRAFLTKLDFPPRNRPDLCHVINTTVVTKLMQSKVALLGNQTYHIEKEVGRGAYGAVYRAVNAYSGDVVALKVQKPPNSWEMYICSEVKKRIANQDILPGFMGISSAVLARNASILISEFSPYGSLLDINNRIRQATTKVMHESLVMHFTSQILNIVDHLHSCKIIHADIKPDNFLLMKIPTSDSHVPTIRLIDFGCAIDMTLFDDRTQFKKVIQTDGFTCVEMQEGRPWSYQTDLFCVAGTVHVMLFGEYMQLLKKFGAWDIKQKLPRYLKKGVWTEIFTKLLNIKSLDHLPDLQHLKSLVDDEMYNMESELQKQIRTLSNILHKR